MMCSHSIARKPLILNNLKRRSAAQPVKPAKRETPLTPAQFRALVRAKGYTLAMLARAWGFSPARVTQIADLSDRPAHFDLALWGTPPTPQRDAMRARRDDYVRRLAGVAKRTQRASAAGPAGPTFSERDHWEAAIAIGAEFVSDAELGDHIPEGCVAVVESVAGQGDARVVSLRFSTGYVEGFQLAFLRQPTCFLWARGIER
jgi:hypothetical protein